MSEIKWIKLVPDWYNDGKIKQLKTMPDRFALTTVWFCLLGLAGMANDYGRLTLGGSPYDEEMLANEFEIERHVIRTALAVFKRFGMIEIIKDENCIYITNWEKHQNLDGMEKIREQSRLRMAKTRARRKLLADSTNCGNTSKKNNDESVTVAQHVAQHVAQRCDDVTLQNKNIDKDIIDTDIECSININNCNNIKEGITTFAPNDFAEAKSNSEHEDDPYAINPNPKHRNPSLKTNKPLHKKDIFEKQMPINFNFVTQKWESITSGDGDIWKEAYPACDVKIELAKMKAWLIANPKKRKKNYRHFINNWLSNAQDKGGTRGLGSGDGTGGFKFKSEMVREANIRTMNAVIDKHLNQDSEENAAKGVVGEPV